MDNGGVRHPAFTPDGAHVIRAAHGRGANQALPGSIHT